MTNVFDILLFFPDYPTTGSHLGWAKERFVELNHKNEIWGSHNIVDEVFWDGILC